MFAQANSEHCRHKIFNASWIIDAQVQEKSLFAMIKNTRACSPRGVLSAFGLSGEIRTARQTIHHSAAQPSRIVLPVIP